MNVNPSGCLVLHQYDLNESDRNIPTEKLEDWHFSTDAQIGAAYANKAGYKVIFARAGEKPIEISRVGGRYFKMRRLKKNGWPVAFRKDSPRLASGGSK